MHSRFLRKWSSLQTQCSSYRTCAATCRPRKRTNAWASSSTWCSNEQRQCEPMMAAVNALQSTLKAENEQRGSSNTQISSQIQSLNDSVDELKTRIANLTAQVQSIQGQLQNVNGMPAQPGGAPPPAAGHAGKPGREVRQRHRNWRLRPRLRPPVDQLYQSALRDYNSASTTLRYLNSGCDSLLSAGSDGWKCPVLPWVRSTTGKASTRRRSRTMTQFWNSTQVIPKPQPPNCARTIVDRNGTEGCWGS